MFRRPKVADRVASGRNVSFSSSSKSSSQDQAVVIPTSRTSSPRPLYSSHPSHHHDEHLPSNRNLQTIDLKASAIWQNSPPQTPDTPFQIYAPSFSTLLGPFPSLTLLLHDPRAPFFHSPGTFHPPTNTLFLTSALLPSASPSAVSSASQTITLSKLEFFSPTDYTRDKIRHPESNHMLAGSCLYASGLVFAAQGTLRDPAGLFYMSASRPHKTTPLLTHFHSRPFNSPYAVVAHSDHSLWFSDPASGHAHGFRPTPTLPQHVYRFDPATGDVRVVADGFDRPAGLCFAPDERTLYVSDTGARRPDGGMDPTRAATIYAYDVVYSVPSHGDEGAGGPFLANRRVFAYASVGVPDGISCDRFGNLWAGCGDGVHVWERGGRLMGKILVEGGVRGCCWGGEGEMWLAGGEKLWRVQVAEGVGRW